MWACLKDQDTTNHWRQVAGWRKVCDLAQAHLGRLQSYRRGLAEAWPPEANAASQAYIRELDDLIDQVRKTHDAAAANYTALAAATQAIGSTRAALEKIHDEYAVKVQQKRSYEATAADPKAIVGSRVSDSPVTDADLERLNVRARGIMYGLSSELQQAQVALRQPPPVPKNGTGFSQQEPNIYGTGSAGGSAAPIIPSITPIQMPPVSAPTHRQNTSMPQIPVIKTSGTGPVLGGAGSGWTPNLTTQGRTPTGPGNLNGPPPNPEVTPPTGKNQRGTSSLGHKIWGGFHRSVPSEGKPTAHPPTPPPRTGPPGGVIGGAPGLGLTQPGQGNTQPRRINPIGGVIGGGGAGTAPTGGAGSRPGGGKGFGGAHGIPPLQGLQGPGGVSQGGTVSASGRPMKHDRVNDGSKSWDPTNPWEVDRGVDPVVRPPDEEGPIDPGPTIGLNR